MVTKFIRLVKWNFPFLVTFFVFIFYCPYGIAQDEEKAFLHNEIKSCIRFSPSRSSKNWPGTVRIVESDSEYSYELRLFDKLPVTFTLGNKYIDIEDSVPVKLPSRLVGWTADIETFLPFFKVKDTYVGLGISPSFYSANWDIKASAFRISSRYILAYRPTTQWTFIGGVAVYPGYENVVLPIAGFIYKPTDKLTFRIVPDDPSITYSFNDIISIFAEGDISLDEFEVEGANLEDVVLRYKEGYAGGGLELRYKEFIRASLSAGGIFGRSLKYSDNTAKVSIKDGFYSTLKISVLF